jgi:hypothetical protein
MIMKIMRLNYDIRWMCEPWRVFINDKTIYFNSHRFWVLLQHTKVYDDSNTLDFEIRVSFSQVMRDRKHSCYRGERNPWFYTL